MRPRRAPPAGRARAARAGSALPSRPCAYIHASTLCAEGRPAAAASVRRSQAQRSPGAAWLRGRRGRRSPPPPGDRSSAASRSRTAARAGSSFAGTARGGISRRHSPWRAPREMAARRLDAQGGSRNIRAARARRARTRPRRCPGSAICAEPPAGVVELLAELPAVGIEQAASPIASARSAPTAERMARSAICWRSASLRGCLPILCAQFDGGAVEQFPLGERIVLGRCPGRAWRWLGLLLRCRCKARRTRDGERETPIQSLAQKGDRSASP